VNVVNEQRERADGERDRAACNQATVPKVSTNFGKVYGQSSGGQSAKAEAEESQGAARNYQKAARKKQKVLDCDGSPVEGVGQDKRRVTTSIRPQNGAWIAQSTCDCLQALRAAIRPFAGWRA